MSNKKRRTKPTYRELLEYLKKIPEERLDDNPAIFDGTTGEVYPVSYFSIANSTQDIVDEGHVLLCVFT